MVPKTAPETDVPIQMAQVLGGVVEQDSSNSYFYFQFHLPPISLLDEETESDSVWDGQTWHGPKRPGYRRGARARENDWYRAQPDA